MVSRESQDQRLAEWLQELGCPLQLAESDLRRLNSPNLRSLWRHLQNHVKSTQNVKTIRNNLRLKKAKIQNLNSALEHSNDHSKTDSINVERSLMENSSSNNGEISVVQQELNKLKLSLKETTLSYFEKVAEKENKKFNLQELKDKTVFLKLKLTSMRKDIDKFNEIVNTCKDYMKLCKSPDQSSSVIKHERAVVARYINEYEFSFNDTEEDEAPITDLISSLVDYPANTILEGISQVSYQVSKSLNAFRSTLNLSKINRGKPSFKLSPCMNYLNSLVIENEIQIHHYLENIKVKSADLEKDKTVLLKAILELSKDDYFTNTDENVLSPSESLEVILKKTSNSKREKLLQDLIDKLESQCITFDESKSLVSSLHEKENALWKVIEKKVAEINSHSSMVCKNTVIFTKNHVFQKCCELATTFSNELKLKDGEISDNYLFSENLVENEIDKFLKVPMIALTRKWEQGDMCFFSSMKDLTIENKQNKCLLLQSEPKNIIKGTLELIRWTSHMNEV